MNFPLLKSFCMLAVSGDALNGFINNLMQYPFFEFIRVQNLSYLTPELIILITLLASIFQVFSPFVKERQDTVITALSGLVIALVCFILHAYSIYFPKISFELPTSGMTQIVLNPSVFFGMFQADLFSLVMRFLIVLGTIIVILTSRKYIEDRTPFAGEFYIMLLGATLGAMLLTGARDLIMVFVALETLGISSYALVGFLRGNEKSAEASLKYLLYGGASSAVLLFGFSLLYGITNGATNYSDIAHILPQVSAPFMTALIPVAFVMIIAGFAFKLSVAPFHMWAPDVYEGAPTPITAYLSIVSKIAGFALAIRFFSELAPGLFYWQLAMIIIAVLSMTIGNFVALTQRNIKRLLAYSTIAHAGYLLLGFVVMTTQSLSSMVFYLFAYIFMNLGAFACAIYFANLTGSEDIPAFAGLVKKRPALVMAFSLFLLSLAGIPITAGFFAKFFLFQSVLANNTNFLWLIIIALLNSTVSLYYYLNVMRLMLIADPSPEVERIPAEDRGFTVSPLGFAITICFIGTLIVGLLAEPVLNLSRVSVDQLPTVSVPQNPETYISNMK